MQNYTFFYTFKQNDLKSSFAAKQIWRESQHMSRFAPDFVLSIIGTVHLPVPCTTEYTQKRCNFQFIGGCTFFSTLLKFIYASQP